MKAAKIRSQRIISWLKENIKSKLDLFLLVTGVGIFFFTPISIGIVYAALEYERFLFISDRKLFSQYKTIQIKSVCNSILVLDTTQLPRKKFTHALKKRAEKKDSCFSSISYVNGVFHFDANFLNTNARKIEAVDSNFIKIAVLSGYSHYDSSIAIYYIDRRYLE